MLARILLCISLAVCTATASLTLPAQAQEVKPVAAVNPVAKYLQSSSVTIRAGNSAGSGVLVKTKDGQVWVWTAAHVVRGLRTVRDGPSGNKIVEFEDAKVLRYLNDKSTGRIVSSYSGDAEVIRYSDAEYGNDLALLRLRDKTYKPDASAVFYLDKDIPEIGAELYHCGSLLGPMGSNSLTSGIVSQHGRVIDGRVFTQTTCTAFPGSSGGVVCLKNDGRYIGMLVMGAGEGFNLLVPVHRMRTWAKKVGIDFAMDPSVEVPDDEKLMSKPIDDAVVVKTDATATKQRSALGLKFMLHDDRDPMERDLKAWFARPGLSFTPE